MDSDAIGKGGGELVEIHGREVLGIAGGRESGKEECGVCPQAGKLHLRNDLGEEEDVEAEFEGDVGRGGEFGGWERKVKRCGGKLERLSARE